MSHIDPNSPTKFLTRLRKYRLEFGPSYKEIVTEVQNIVIEHVEEAIEENEIVSEIKEHIRSLTDFTESTLQHSEEKEFTVEADYSAVEENIPEYSPIDAVRLQPRLP
jgi:hypothetical protein